MTMSEATVQLFCHNTSVLDFLGFLILSSAGSAGVVGTGSRKELMLSSVRCRKVAVARSVGVFVYSLASGDNRTLTGSADVLMWK